MIRETSNEKRAADAARAFQDAKSNVYRNATSEPSRRDLVVLGMFPPGKDLRVLDYGCGSGRFLRVLKTLGHEGMGMDISEEAVRFAGESGVNAVVGNAETKEGFLNLNGTYDIITVLDVLEHTFDPAEVIHHLASFLREDGCIIASVPNIACLPARTTIMLGRFPMNPSGLFDSGHIRWFTRSNLSGYIEQAGGASLIECRGTPLPAVSRFGLWRLERVQDRVLGLLARCWPSLWAYQLVFKMVPARSKS